MHPLLRQGFRPFFLLAALHALVGMPLWLLLLEGGTELSLPVSPSFWHSHEMLFGYTTAVIAGFLLTAAARWTERPTATGTPLAALALLWLLGRVLLMGAMDVPWLARALVDLAFIPALGVAVGLPIALSKNRRNYVMLVLLAGLWGANAVMHADALGIGAGLGRRAALFATNLVVLMMLVIGGRVIPMFTRNVVRSPAIVNRPMWDRLAVGGMALVTVSELLVPGQLLVALLSAITAVLVLVRAVSWGAAQTRRHPMLWVLHVGHGWIVLGLFLSAFSALHPPLSGAALHAYTAGAIGTLTLGMMCRVALGHTGRLIVASRWTTLAFLLMIGGGVVRVIAPIVPSVYQQGIVVAGIAWSLSLLVFVLEFAPILGRPRADGAPG